MGTAAACLPGRVKKIMCELCRLVQKIRRAPAMFFGNEMRLSDLDNFLGGYQYALYNFSLEKSFDSLLPLPFRYFGPFAALKFGCSDDTFRWDKIILAQVSQNEEKAAALFFSLFDEFLAIKAVRVQYADLTADHLDFFHHDPGVPRRFGPKGEIPLYRRPSRVYLVKLSAGTVFLVETEEAYCLDWHLYAGRRQALREIERRFGAVSSFGRGCISMISGKAVVCG